MINISLVLTKVNETAFDRGMIFVSVITVIYSANFIYLVVKVLFLNETIQSVGSPYFLVHSFYNFSILIGYLIIILIYGSEANAIDFELQNILNKLQVDCNEADLLQNRNRVYTTHSGEIDIILTKENGQFYSLRQKKCIENIDGYISINSRLKQKIEELNG